MPTLEVFYQQVGLTTSVNVWDVSGRHLCYIDYLNEYRWDLASKRWIRRTTTKVPSIGRLIYKHPACGEAFYLRMLLAHQKGCQSFNCIKTVNGHLVLLIEMHVNDLG